MAVDVEWLGELDEVGQDVAKQGSGAVAVQQVDAEAGEAADQVELAQGWELSVPDAVLCLLQALTGDRLDMGVEGREGPGVGGLAGGVQDVGDGRGALVEARGGACVDGFASHGGSPALHGGPLPGAGAGSVNVQQSCSGGASAK